jgi:hypothetical protein
VSENSNLPLDFLSCLPDLRLLHQAAYRATLILLRLSLPAFITGLPLPHPPVSFMAGRSNKRRVATSTRLLSDQIDRRVAAKYSSQSYNSSSMHSTATGSPFRIHILALPPPILPSIVNISTVATTLFTTEPACFEDLHTRRGGFKILHNAGRLFQEFIVDAYDNRIGCAGIV